MKKLSLLLILALFTVMAVGCAPQTIVYDGKEQDVTTVEEILSDKLEVENPELDLNVNISTESDD